MREKIKKALISIDLKNLNIEENKKSRENKHKKFFLKILNTLISIQERSDRVFTQYGLKVNIITIIYKLLCILNFKEINITNHQKYF